MLADLLEGEFDDVNRYANAQLADLTEITGIACDSRRVEPGFLFAALPGTVADGRAFIDDAVARGATAVLAPSGTVAPTELAVPLIEGVNARRSYAVLASRFYAHQPETIAAVTGTNGKTSVVNFLRQIWCALGHRAASAGTLGTQARGDGLNLDYPGSLTTPDPADLHATLADLAGHGVGRLAIEASSHGLDQYRLDGVRVHLAAFTNLSRDHLDYHGDEATYMAAKTRLFSELLDADGVAVLNADSTAFDSLATACRARGCRVVGFGRAGLDIRLLDVEATGSGQRLAVSVSGRITTVHLPLIGDFQASNALCAAGLAIASGDEAQVVLDALETLQGVRGRLELAGTLPNGASVFVDYAHTPDALETVLKAMRPHAQGRLHVVFGCGGDRDKGKRSEMGRAAANNADQIIVTDDNPRTEAAASIRDQAMAGCPSAQNIADRHDAIHAAVGNLAAGDLLVVAGKGHEQGQIIGDEVRPFDDVSVVQAAIAEMKERSS